MNDNWFTEAFEAITKLKEKRKQHEDAALAVVEAAQLVASHVNVTGSWGRLGSEVIDVEAREGDRVLMAQYYAADPPPDTLLGTLTMLVNALAAYEQLIEDDTA